MREVPEIAGLGKDGECVDWADARDGPEQLVVSVIRAIELLDARRARPGAHNDPPHTVYRMPQRHTSEIHERSMKAEEAKREYLARQTRTKDEAE